MKTHAIIPIFLPHIGCPNDCVFCNQRVITAKQEPVSGSQVEEQILRCLSTMEGRGLSAKEIAFFGGSFTGIPINQQREYLTVAQRYKKEGRIDKIRLSTRPDYIDSEILTHLASFDVDVIELGVQSMNDEVLRLAGRGHDSEAVRRAAVMIRDRGFTLGVQLMIGLPGDSPEICRAAAVASVGLAPDVARLYPTLILKDTHLARLFQQGKYKPYSLEETLAITKEMYRILTDAGIQVIRVGLKSTEGIGDGSQVLGGAFHPAFRQLVEGELAREQIEEQLEELLHARAQQRLQELQETSQELSQERLQSRAQKRLRANPQKPSQKRQGSVPIQFSVLTVPVVLESNSRCFSNLIGQHGKNRSYFTQKYPNVDFRFRINPALPEGVYRLT